MTHATELKRLGRIFSQAGKLAHRYQASPYASRMIRAAIGWINRSRAHYRKGNAFMGRVCVHFAAASLRLANMGV